MRANFAAHSLICGQRRGAFGNSGQCWGGGVGKALQSYELLQVSTWIRAILNSELDIGRISLHET